MTSPLAPGLDRRGLRIALVALFVALAAPVAVLVREARHQIEREAFHQYRAAADELGVRIDAALQRAIAAEEARGYADYRFVVVAGDPATSTFVQRSPLSRFPLQSPLPGLVGYFQVDADGAFSTPLLPPGADPSRWGLAAGDVEQRAAVRDELVAVLGRHRLVDPARATLAQGGFDQLNAPGQQALRNELGRIDDLPLAQNFGNWNAAPSDAAQQQAAVAAKRAKRKEQAALVEGAPTGVAAAPAPVSLFESEVDPFEFSVLDDDYAVLFRKAWRDGRRTIQGALVQQRAFVQDAIATPFLESALAPVGDLVVAWRGDVIRVVRRDGDGTNAGAVSGELLHQLRLSAPLGDVQLIWNVRQLPAGPGARVVLWASLAALVVLVVGCVLSYRVGLRQIALVRQQRDFVAAVSHELKTPLTSVRLYAEILREGWASDEKKREYYDFIHDESERLSRLIANVLQLARMESGGLRLDRKPHRADTLIDLARSKLARQIEHAGFTARYDIDPACAARELDVDPDAFVQMLINLVDNALKFARAAERKEVEIGVAPHGADALRFTVRDYGPGVEKSQRRRIFELFYRGGDELVRSAPGTGIGLALVRQLARALGGDVDVVDGDPGAEFGVILPAAPIRP